MPRYFPPQPLLILPSRVFSFRVGDTLALGAFGGVPLASGAVVGAALRPLRLDTLLGQAMPLPALGVGGLPGLPPIDRCRTGSSTGSSAGAVVPGLVLRHSSPRAVHHPPHALLVLSCADPAPILPYRPEPVLPLDRWNRHRRATARSGPAAPLRFPAGHCQMKSAQASGGRNSRHGASRPRA